MKIENKKNFHYTFYSMRSRARSPSQSIVYGIGHAIRSFKHGEVDGFLFRKIGFFQSSVKIPSNFHGVPVLRKHHDCCGIGIKRGQEFFTRNYDQVL